MPSIAHLPKEQIDQLQTIGRNGGYGSIQETMRKLIGFARDQGLIDHAIPGVRMNVLSDGIVVDLGGGPIDLSFDAALRLAATIRHVVQTGGGAGACVDVIASTRVVQVGRGIAISIPDTPAGRKVMAPAVAHDFSDVIEAVVAKGQAEPA